MGQHIDQRLHVHVDMRACVFHAEVESNLQCARAIAKQGSSERSSDRGIQRLATVMWQIKCSTLRHPSVHPSLNHPTFSHSIERSRGRAIERLATVLPPSVPSLSLSPRPLTSPHPHHCFKCIDNSRRMELSRCMRSKYRRDYKGRPSLPNLPVRGSRVHCKKWTPDLAGVQRCVA